MPLHQEFPVLSSGLVYLDSAAKSLTPTRVVHAMNRYYRECDANVARGVQRLARRATALVDDARERIARLVHASPEEIVFVRGTTEAIGMVCSRID